MSKKISLRLTLNCTYEYEYDTDRQEIIDQLDGLVPYAFNRGLLSGDLDAVVDGYDYKVEELT